MRAAKARVEAERKRELAVAKQTKVEKIEAAKTALEAGARQQATATGKDPTIAQPAPTAQRNFTDPRTWRTRRTGGKGCGGEGRQPAGGPWRAGERAPRAPDWIGGLPPGPRASRHRRPPFRPPPEAGRRA